MSDYEKDVKGDWGTGKIHADGSATFNTKVGRLEVSEDTTPRMYIDKIERIIIYNITDLVSHNIESSDIATSHHIIFKDEGVARISYRHDGKVLEFQADHMIVEIDNDYVITLKRYENPQE